jgi:hypothetical protein
VIFFIDCTVLRSGAAARTLQTLLKLDCRGPILLKSRVDQIVDSSSQLDCHWLIIAKTVMQLEQERNHA